MVPALVHLALIAPVPLHLGPMHAHERLLVLLIAFGPFLVLAVVVFVIRRRDVAADDREGAGTPDGQGGDL